MASILIAGLLTLVLGFAIGWLAAWVASLRAPGVLSALWRWVLLGAGVLAAVLLVLLITPLGRLPSISDEGEVTTPAIAMAPPTGLNKMCSMEQSWSNAPEWQLYTT